MSNSNYTIPLDPHSPWPKFRADARQSGRSDAGTPGTARPWVFQTGRGIFSSPVIDAEGVVYIGSADHFFYAINPDGTEKWRYRTGNLIDSSALLDDKGRVYFGSADSCVYALERGTGEFIWKFRAHEPGSLPETSKMCDWFEGNIAIGPDGTLYTSSDNFLLYAIDRDTGAEKWHYAMRDQAWSLPAVNTKTGRLFFGSCFFTLKNLHCTDLNGKQIWTRGTLGSMVASPLLTSDEPDAAVIAGGFDGIVRAFSQRSGRRLWKFGTREHIYSSPAQLSDGTIIQPGADGSIYAINPETGKCLWSFDTPEPFRASPAVDRFDHIYAGNGEGRLYCLNPDGKLRWAYSCITAERRDLNGSPGLGSDGVVVAGHSGEVFFIPYDYPLSEAGSGDPRCILSVDTPPDGARLVRRKRYGGRADDTESLIGGNESITCTLEVTRDGIRQPALLDKKGVTVDADARCIVSADRKFLTVIPERTWTDSGGGEVSVRLTGKYRIEPRRFGLKFFGGKNGGVIAQTIKFQVEPYGGDVDLQAGTGPGSRYAEYDFKRLAPQIPVILPSYNQIGFDSIYYQLGLHETDGRHVIWCTGADFDAETGKTVRKPGSNIRFVLEPEADGKLLTLRSPGGFTLEFNGWDMPYKLFRLAMRHDDNGRPAGETTKLDVLVNCDAIRFYGRFMKLLGVSDVKTGMMLAAAAVDVEPAGMQISPVAEDAVFERAGEGAKVTFSGFDAAEHNFGLLLFDSDKRPLCVNYSQETIVQCDDGRITVTVGRAPGAAAAWLMIDTGVAAVREL